MKKIYLPVIAAAMLAACTKDIPAETPPAGDAITTIADPSIDAGDADAGPSTRAAVTPLIQSDNVFWCSHSICLDTQGYFCGMYSKSYWNKYAEEYWSSTYYLYDFFDLRRLSRSACVDANDASYFITQENRIIKVTTDYNSPHVSGASTFAEVANIGNFDLNIVDLTPAFPAGLVFLSLTAADNGNVFVTTGNASDGGYGDTFPDHTVYRISAAGRATEIVTVEVPVAATQISNWSNEEVPEGWLPGIDQIEYPNILTKSNGAVLYGLDANGNGYKIFSASGLVEYFTPRVPVKCLSASLNGNNPYALSGNTIVELRPNLARDIEIGTIPADLAANAYVLRVNADATAFYVGVKSNNEADVYKFTR